MFIDDDEFMDDYEIYHELDRMLPAHVYRGSGEEDMEAGEPECAIMALLDAAYLAGCLTEDIIALIRKQFDGGDVIFALDGLLMLEGLERSK